VDDDCSGLDTAMLEDYWKNSIGTIDTTTWDLRGETNWLDCEGSQPASFDKRTYEEFEAIFE